MKQQQEKNNYFPKISKYKLTIKYVFFIGFKNNKLIVFYLLGRNAPTLHLCGRAASIIRRDVIVAKVLQHKCQRESNKTQPFCRLICVEHDHNINRKVALKPFDIAFSTVEDFHYFRIGECFVECMQRSIRMVFQGEISDIVQTVQQNTNEVSSIFNCSKISPSSDCSALSLSMYYLYRVYMKMSVCLTVCVIILR